MPFGDKKGPSGQGPMTGRKQGKCTGNDSAGYNHPGRMHRNQREASPDTRYGNHMGQFRGHRQGRGYGHFNGPGEERTRLRKEIQILQERLDKIDKNS